ncbi:hypothetical protein G6F62_014349 [Rhizopus arrhizus]|nr:hypothetical protein G6F62_014349 [Rhizopus arrhizus]
MMERTSFVACAVHQRHDLVGRMAGLAGTARAQQPQDRLGRALAASQRVRAAGAVAARQLVAQLDQDRETDGGVQVALGHMEAQAFGHQTEADHQQQAQAQDHHRGVTADERHQRAAGQHHDGHREDHGDHHDAQVLHHAHRGNHGVQ